jgi:hypothetical protein
VAGKPGRDPLAAFGLASAMDEVEYQSYLAIAVCLDAIQEQQGSWRARHRSWQFLAACQAKAQ